MTIIVEAMCSISKSRGDRLLVTHTQPFGLSAVKRLDTGAHENPFNVPLNQVPVAPIVIRGAATGVFGAHMPPLRPDAPETAYEIRWLQDGPIEAGVVFVVDR